MVRLLEIEWHGFSHSFFHSYNLQDLQTLKEVLETCPARELPKGRKFSFPRIFLSSLLQSFQDAWVQLLKQCTTLPHFYQRIPLRLPKATPVVMWGPCHREVGGVTQWRFLSPQDALSFLALCTQKCCFLIISSGMPTWACKSRNPSVLFSIEQDITLSKQTYSLSWLWLKPEETITSKQDSSEILRSSCHRFNETHWICYGTCRPLSNREMGMAMSTTWTHTLNGKWKTRPKNCQQRWKNGRCLIKSLSK